MPRRWVVSVESLSMPARTAILKSLQARLGLPLVADDAAVGKHQLARLLHRVRALGKLPPDQHALCTGSWTSAWRAGAAGADLTRALTRALMDKLVPGGMGGTGHLVVRLAGPTAPDEAFEALMPLDRDVTLHMLHDAQASLLQVDDSHNPFEAVRIVDVRYPPHAIDNPVCLEAVVDDIEARCRAVLDTT